MTVSGNRIFPPERARTKNGTTSGVAWAKIETMSLRTLS